MSIPTSTARTALFAIADAIVANKQMLSEVDGAIGDGDHGINMAKGFNTFKQRYGDSDMSFAALLDALGMILLNEIGGSMGPLYGSAFMEMGDAMQGVDTITPTHVDRMVTVASETVAEIGGAKVGDKTLIDVLVPCQTAVSQAVADGADLAACLKTLKHHAIIGRDSTKDLIAKVGRASRLGDRSRGVLDAGACSCCIIWVTLADSLVAELT